jgi:hypothetical protein
MKILVNCNLPLKGAGYISPELMDALVRLYLSAVHQVHELDLRSISISPEHTLSEIGDTAGLGACGSNVETIEFDCAVNPSESRLPNGEVYLALAVVYAWVEYCWDDIDKDDAKKYFEYGESVEMFIRHFADKYDISSLDPLTRKHAGCKLFHSVTEPAVN